MTILLAIDATERACSVALSISTAVNGESNTKKTVEKFTSEPRQHAKQILPMIRQLLAEEQLSKNQIDGVAVGIGPGSFTGLRIALSIAQSLAYALSKPVFPVSSLLSMALQAKTLDVSMQTAAPVFVGLDARMGEVYCAGFTLSSSGEIQRETEDLLLSQEDAVTMASDYAFGLGSALAIECFSEVSFTDSNAQAQVHAADICRLAIPDVIENNGVSALTLEPAYLRRENAWQKLDQQGLR